MIKILVQLSRWPSRVGKISCRGKWQPTPVFLPGRNSMDRGAWWATVLGVTAKSGTQLRDSHVCARTHTHTRSHGGSWSGPALVVTGNKALEFKPEKNVPHPWPFVFNSEASTVTFSPQHLHLLLPPDL